MLPFTPSRKDNLTAWMVARSDPERYGQLEVFEFPKQKVIYGPRQIVARINQDQVISPQITLWNQQGSQVIQGTLLVIPVEEALLYVRPLYLRASGGKIPELNRVIVAYRDQIVMAETLDAALDGIFGGGNSAPGRGESQTRGGSRGRSVDQRLPGLHRRQKSRARARQHYDVHEAHAKATGRSTERRSYNRRDATGK